jgi:hypothetical protein
MQLTLNFSQYIGEEHVEDKLTSFLKTIYDRNLEKVDFAAIMRDQEKLSVETEGL